MADPPRISVTRHPDEDVRVKISESEFIQTRLIMDCHDLPLKQILHDQGIGPGHTNAVRWVEQLKFS